MAKTTSKAAPAAGDTGGRKAKRGDEVTLRYVVGGPKLERVRAKVLAVHEGPEQLVDLETTYRGASARRTVRNVPRVGMRKRGPTTLDAPAWEPLENGSAPEPAEDASGSGT
jgi:hypothetical protein